MTDKAHGAPPFRSFLQPGDWVIHPNKPEWGEGQVQSATGRRVVVTFEHAGKMLIDAALVTLHTL